MPALLGGLATRNMVVVAVVAVVVLAVIVIGMVRITRKETFVLQPKELESATYKAHATEPCTLVDDGELASAAYLETGRLRALKSDTTGSSCYFLNDERHSAQDMMLSGKACDIGEGVFQNPMIKRAYTLTSKDAGEAVPLQKCVLEFDKAAVNPTNIGQLWDNWGKVECAQVVAPVRQANKRLRATLAKSQEERDALASKRDGLTSQKIACDQGLKGCTERLNATTSEWNAIKAHTNSCLEAYDALKADYKGYYDKMQSNLQDLDVKLGKCTSGRADAQRRLGVCEETLENVRQNHGVLQGKVSELEQVRVACQNKVTDCRVSVRDARSRMLDLDANVKSMRSMLDTCEGELETTQSVFQKHRDNISTPCQLKLPTSQREMMALKKELDACSQELRKEGTENAGLKAKLASLMNLLGVLEPENRDLTSKLSDCKRALANVKRELDDCMGKLGGLHKLHDRHISRLTSMNQGLLTKQKDIVGDYCARAIIGPPAVTEDDKQKLLTDIDDCRERLEKALNERDDYRQRYMTLLPKYNQLEIDYAVETNARDWFRDMFHNMDAVKAKHGLCEVCVGDGIPWTVSEFIAGFKFYALEAKDGEKKTRIFGGGEGSMGDSGVTINTLAVGTVEGQLKEITESTMAPVTWVGIMPSYEKVEGTIWWKSPKFKLAQPVTAKVTVKFDDDFMFWVNGRPIWGGSWHGVENNDRTKTFAVAFDKDNTYQFSGLYFNNKDEGYAYVSDGLTELADAMDNGEVTKLEGTDPDDAIIAQAVAAARATDEKKRTATAQMQARPSSTLSRR